MSWLATVGSQIAAARKEIERKREIFSQSRGISEHIIKSVEAGKHINTARLDEFADAVGLRIVARCVKKDGSDFQPRTLVVGQAMPENETDPPLARYAHEAAMQVALDGTEKERKEFRRLISVFVANLGHPATDAGGAGPSTATEFHDSRATGQDGPDRRQRIARDTGARRRSTDPIQRKTSRSTVPK